MLRERERAWKCAKAITKLTAGTTMQRTVTEKAQHRPLKILIQVQPKQDFTGYAT